MYCQKCGAKINDTAAFCEFCGASLNADVTTISVTNNVENSKDSHANSGFVLGIIAISLFTAFFFLMESNFNTMISSILFLLGAVPLAIIGFIFSIIGIKSKKYKIKAILGLVFSSIVLGILTLSFISVL